MPRSLFDLPFLSKKRFAAWVLIHYARVFQTLAVTSSSVTDPSGVFNGEGREENSFVSKEIYPISRFAREMV